MPVQQRTPGQYLRLTALIFICFILSGIPDAGAGRKTAPVLNDGKKWRIAYLEGGTYINYSGSLKSTIRSLMTLGWIRKEEFPPFSNLENTHELWTWLSRSDRSPYLNFMGDAYWSSEWKDEKRKQNAAEIERRIRTERDIDLFMAMGTWAGQDLVGILEKIPVVVMSTTDPVKAKIVKSPEDSGKDNVHAWCDPARTERRLKLFHDILDFRRLGIIYEDSEDGRIYANLPPIKKISETRGFRLVECRAPDTGRTLEECRDGVAKCIAEIAANIDALAVSDHRGFHPGHMPEIIEPLFQNGVPVFTPVWGPDVVRRGVLMGIAREDYMAMGGFYADTIAQILNGVKPGELIQIFKEPLKLAVNLEAARILKYDVPANVKKIADILYYRIERTPLE